MLGHAYAMHAPWLRRTCTQAISWRHTAADPVSCCASRGRVARSRRSNVESAGCCCGGAVGRGASIPPSMRDPGRPQLLPPSEEDEQQSAARKAERDEKLRAREMLPMPSTVAAGSVYLDPDGLEKEGGGVPIDEVEGAGASHAEAPTQAAVGAAGAADAPAPPTLTMMKQAGVDDATLAASGSGVSASYTSGMQVGWS